MKKFVSGLVCSPYSFLIPCIVTLFLIGVLLHVPAFVRVLILIPYAALLFWWIIAESKRVS